MLVSRLQFCKSGYQAFRNESATKIAEAPPLIRVTIMLVGRSVAAAGSALILYLHSSKASFYVLFLLCSYCLYKCLYFADVFLLIRLDAAANINSPGANLLYCLRHVFRSEPACKQNAALPGSFRGEVPVVGEAASSPLGGGRVE